MSKRCRCTKHCGHLHSSQPKRGGEESGRESGQTDYGGAQRAGRTSHCPSAPASKSTVVEPARRGARAGPPVVANRVESIPSLINSNPTMCFYQSFPSRRKAFDASSSGARRIPTDGEASRNVWASESRRSCRGPCVVLLRRCIRSRHQRPHAVVHPLQRAAGHPCDAGRNPSPCGR